MDESNMPALASSPPPKKKSDRTVLLIAIGMALGLIALIALNMN